MFIYSLQFILIVDRVLIHDVCPSKLFNIPVEKVTRTSCENREVQVETNHKLDRYTNDILSLEASKRVLRDAKTGMKIRAKLPTIK